MRVLITGVTGFVGRHLVEYLAATQPQVEVYGLQRWRPATEGRSPTLAGMHVLHGDLLDAPSLMRAVAACRPAAVVHLAASSSVARSWETPTEMLQTNVLGTVHLLEAVRQLGLDIPVVLAGSAESYGLVAPEELPVGESQPFRPLSPYAVSKAATDLLGYQYFKAFGMRTVRLRLFNHCGPGQAEQFVVAAFARQLAEIEAGLRPALVSVGNLHVVRDFVDVRDAARAYWLAVERGVAGEAYNVASGCARTLKEVLDRLLALSGVRAEIVTDPQRLRPADVPALEGRFEKFAAATGWCPQVPFDTTLRDTLEEWRQCVRGWR